MQNAILGSLKLVQVEVPSEPAVDAAALQRELENQIEGEVRFDTISRALYSTDASVYLIRPLGVVIPKTRESRRSISPSEDELCKNPSIVAGRRSRGAWSPA